jgi:pyruvate formate lyase activating enzyme
MSGSGGSGNPQGVVFDIQRFCIEDGPGIRTSVFLKGCQLRCPWCANPESLVSRPQLAHFHSRCKLCCSCVTSCPVNAIRVAEGRIVVDRETCTDCGVCASACVHGAMTMIGRIMSSSEVIDEVLRDKPFYDESGGGMTLTGGEPSFQPAFASALLVAAHEHAVHTAVETNGSCSLEVMERIAEHTDLFLFDLKVVASASARNVTGGKSSTVLENLARVNELGRRIIVRFPFVPELTDSVENVKRMLDFAAGLRNVAGVNVLPFHQYGRHKYDALGYPYSLAECPPPPRNKVLEFFERLGTPATVTVLG